MTGTLDYLDERRPNWIIAEKIIGRRYDKHSYENEVQSGTYVAETTRKSRANFQSERSVKN
ncbi:unnamed protein product [Dovyalis caffra]|uniref:Uncharacterized protein n=1 Tax=Dovyalis caffra TaxID=77055 RepID=A0AAV1SP54_9ROSI|nr:unnamed protein product [Dovyalis caffra]